MPFQARKAVVVGAGPVGCLCAIALSNMGWEVEIYEARPGTSHALMEVFLFRILTPH